MHLEGYELIQVFRVVATDGDTEYWATDDLEMLELERLKFAEMAWGIEVYHRALKQECGVERAQRNHIGCAIRGGCRLGGMRLEWHRVRTGIGWMLAKEGIIRAALRRSLTHPWYTLPATT